MKKILISVVCLALFASFSFAQESLSVYKKNRGQIDENAPVGSLLFTDYIKELPIPMDSVKKVTVVKEKVVVKDKKGRVKKDKKGNPKTKMQRKRVVTWEKVQPSEPPRFVPIQCKLGEVWVKRADLARFKQASLDLSGEYASSTGSVIRKSLRPTHAISLSSSRMVRLAAVPSSKRATWNCVNLTVMPA